MADTTRSIFTCTAGPTDLSLVRKLDAARLREGPDPARAVGAVTTRGARLRLSGGTPGTPPARPVPVANLVAPKPTLRIRLWVIYATDDDGTLAEGTPRTLAELKPIVSASVEAMRQDWAGTGVEFVFLPDCDLEIRRDRLLNRDFDIPPQVAMEFPIEAGKLTAEQVEGIREATRTTAHRQKVAAERPDRLLLILHTPNAIGLSADGSQWVYSAAVGGSSSGGHIDFALLNKIDFAASAAHSERDASRLAHEIGHFLHLPHTHSHHSDVQELATDATGTVAARLAAWSKRLADHIDGLVPPGSTPETALAALDFDAGSKVFDTPADPGAGIMALRNGGTDGASASGPTGTLWVKPAHVKADVVFKPDRLNVMSYYLDGASNAPMRFSGDQVAVMRGGLLDGNRRRLVAAQLGDTAEPGLRTAAVWSPSTAGQFLSLGQRLDEHRRRHEEWTDKGFRMGWQCAYVRGGQVLYDAAWDAGARNQHVIFGWAEADVEKEVASQKQAGRRVAHVDAYRHPGTDLRYNVIFEPGSQEQVVLLNRSRQQIGDAWNALMPKHNRFRHLDSAVDHLGALRFAAVMQPGTQAQHFRTDAALEMFAAEYDTQWQANRRLTSITLAAGPGSMRYSGLWDPEAAGQFVMWLHVRERILEMYDEMWCRGFRLRSLVTVAV